MILPNLRALLLTPSSPSCEGLATSPKLLNPYFDLVDRAVGGNSYGTFAEPGPTLVYLFCKNSDKRFKSLLMAKAI
ncbi:hypothetical protein PanWU01x14_030280 [Parasponia andersonii]|uniref:Uncharacterized protein n=1 Tax=Parasponia andersonii TaxID=3476 RepID=A0A2P5DUU4_PARAD|nr:hypothetical protein PanWU01x14_030280 [Parasponia andersonii]